LKVINRRVLRRCPWGLLASVGSHGKKKVRHGCLSALRYACIIDASLSHAPSDLEQIRFLPFS
jgi:hypothetical protein